jgi:hypothetical protein
MNKPIKPTNRPDYWKLASLWAKMIGIHSPGVDRRQSSSGTHWDEAAHDAGLASLS